MSKTFIYEEGFITEKCEMRKPERGANFPRDGYYHDLFNYEKHLDSLRRYAYPYPCEEGKELVEGVDFKVENTDILIKLFPITQRTYSEQEMQEKNLIIQGIEEGAENWKAEYDNCRAILQLLVELKRIKDTEGKTEFYEKNQPITWEAAKRFLEKYTHL